MFKPSTTSPPIIYGANPSEYHKVGTQFNRGDARRTMSRSELEDFAACPNRWLHGEDKKTTKAMQWGSLLDVAFLAPKSVEEVYVVEPLTYETTRMVCPSCGSATADSKSCAKCKCARVEAKVKMEWSNNSDTCKEWKAEREKEGKTVVTEDKLSDAWKAVARLKQDEEIAGIMAASKTQVQVNVEWHDDGEGGTGLVVPFKCLLDVVPDPKSEFGDTLYDLKSTKDAAAKWWTKQVFNDGLYYQAGVYYDAMNATGMKYLNFGHIIQESFAPYEPTVRALTVEFLQVGINQYREDLRRYCKCLKTGKWPGYDRSPVDLEIWMIREPSTL